MRCDFELSIRLRKPIPDSRGGLIYNVPVPCGKCLNCKKNNANEWSFRINEELKHAENGYFVTLTYHTDTVPMLENGITTLRKADLQKFIKRLRKHEQETKEVNYGYLKAGQQGVKFNEKAKILYFGAGEYGELRYRPHFHLIIMNLRNTDNIQKAWSKAVWNSEIDDYEYIPFGITQVKPAHINLIDYTVKYLHKENTKIYWKIKQGAEKEFHVMSKNLGLQYINKQSIRFHNSDMDNYHLVTDRNFKIPIPKYYRDLLFSEDKKREIVRDIKERMDEKEIKERKEYGDRYDTIKVLSKMARQNRLKKSIKKREKD